MYYILYIFYDPKPSLIIEMPDIVFSFSQEKHYYLIFLSLIFRFSTVHHRKISRCVNILEV